MKVELRADWIDDETDPRVSFIRIGVVEAVVTEEGDSHHIQINLPGNKVHSEEYRDGKVEAQLWAMDTIVVLLESESTIAPRNVPKVGRRPIMREETLKSMKRAANKMDFHPSRTQTHALINSNLAALERITELEWGG